MAVQDSSAGAGSEAAQARGTPREPGAVRAGLQEYGALVRFAWRAIAALPRTLWYISEILRQFAALALESIVLLAFMEAMIGITAANFVYFLVQALGAADFTGIGGELTIRVACVVMFGYVFVSKICGGFVAEIGTMKIGQEISALESIGVDPMLYVVGTRILATVIFIPVATAVSMVTFYFGFYATAVIVLHGVSGAGLNQFYWGSQSINDLVYVFTVIAVVTVFTVITACFYGMRASGGPTAIGEAVARAVVVNIVTLHIVGSVIATLWYATNYGLPIGG
jgi:phospholipid/cholesterol/gamma-HCH transport system permease protein